MQVLVGRMWEVREVYLLKFVRTYCKKFVSLQFDHTIWVYDYIRDNKTIGE